MDSQVERQADRRESGHDIKLEVRRLPDGPDTTVGIERRDTLLDLLGRAATALDLELLPSIDEPLDTLHNLRPRERDELIQDLGQNVEDYLHAPHTTRDFGVRLERVLFVNKKARIAPEPSMTPRQILGLFGLDENFSLYRPDGNEPLPLDSEIPIERGMRLEAQRDGKYGGGAPVTAPLPKLQRELGELEALGHSARLIHHGGQRYVRIDGVPAPTPPWATSRHDILIALPNGYEQGAALDAFYLAQPSLYDGRKHRRVGNAGQPLTLEGQTWLLVSWHYKSAWRLPQDTLVTHVLHCRSFFTEAEA